MIRIVPSGIISTETFNPIFSAARSALAMSACVVRAGRRLIMPLSFFKWRRSSVAIERMAQKCSFSCNFNFVAFYEYCNIIMGLCHRLLTYTSFPQPCLITLTNPYLKKHLLFSGLKFGAAFGAAMNIAIRSASRDRKIEIYSALMTPEKIAVCICGGDNPH